jgi:DNA polymerase-3 subunit chi
MTQVDFHFNAPDKESYVCRLLRKGTTQGHRIGVWANAEMAQALNLSLWNLSPTDFVSHCSVSDSPDVLARSGVVFATDWPTLLSVPQLNVLLNLNAVVPPDLGSVNRLIEVVGSEDDDKSNARQRWKIYTERGYQINRFDVAAKSSPASNE